MQLQLIKGLKPTTEYDEIVLSEVINEIETDFVAPFFEDKVLPFEFNLNFPAKLSKSFEFSKTNISLKTAFGLLFKYVFLDNDSRL